MAHVRTPSVELLAPAGRRAEPDRLIWWFRRPLSMGLFASASDGEQRKGDLVALPLLAVADD